jgi:hypothetical protein
LECRRRRGDRFSYHPKKKVTTCTTSRATKYNLPMQINQIPAHRIHL